ncbi:MAG TPA: YrdB family protein [Candidatus Limnocylindrales bacterium]|nr:YrdB family protein [Candidatus Limnocylindrales bacterium]
MTALNDGLRFLLELAGVAALAVWGWNVGSPGPIRFVLAIAAPLVLLVLWALFIAPRADSPLPPTPRMIVGSALLLVAAGALHLAGYTPAAAAMAALIVVNTALTLILRA